MTKAEVKERIQQHNDSIDTYINVTLAELLEAKNGKIRMDQWFKAQDLIKTQNFYTKGMEILRECRENGFDVKMDMQSNKLVFHGMI